MENNKENKIVYLSFADYKLFIDNVEFKKVKNPPNELKNLFYGDYNCIYKIEYNKNLYQLIYNILKNKNPLNSGCENCNLDISVCQIFMTSKDYIVNKTEFINTYETTEYDLKFENNKFVGIGYFFPKGTKIINKMITISNRNIWLLGLYYKNNILKLHTLYEEKPPQLEWLSNPDRTGRENPDRTGREEAISIYEMNNNNLHIDIKINNNNPSRGSGYSNGYVKLLYFYYKSLNYIDSNLNLEDLYLQIYEFENIKEPIEELSIKEMNLNNSYIIQVPFKISIGECKKDTKIYYIDPISNEQKFFYIDKLEIFDYNTHLENVKAELRKSDDDESKQALELLEFNKIEFESESNAFEPNGKKRLCILWETPESGISFGFYSKEYLDNKVQPKEGSSAFIFYGKNNYIQGLNGYKQQISFVDEIYVDPNFNGCIEVEAFSISIVNCN